ncbi:MAG TPA: isocitrate lyase/phosphoenolpyruvate mutase family protein [Candidatus Dormibacteraeota bacterium]|nr:isocitrate lyase/phosphoenolpyruvate mutase family protein [Candidatus Dormibacteraeota bacterium]
MTDLADKARRLRELHKPGDPLLLANAWDVRAAKAVEEAGFPAVATTSSAIALALGYEDGQKTPADEMFAAVGRIAHGVDVPVTADLEAGYGLPAAEIVERMIDAGVVGLNYEDTDHDADGPRSLVDAEVQAGRVAELREAATAAGVDVVINARADPYLLGMDDALDECLRRGRLYRDAGADCIFTAGVKDEAEIERLVSDLDKINVLLMPGVPDPARLAKLGVARISAGGGLAHAVMHSQQSMLESLLAGTHYW